MPQGWTAVEEPQGWTPVAEESGRDRLQNAIRKLRAQNEANTRAGIGGTPVSAAVQSSLGDMANTINPVENAIGLGRTAVGMVSSLVPRSLDEAINPVTQFNKFVVNPMVETQGQAGAAYSSGRTAEGVFKDVAAKVPVLGPAASGIYDLAASGKSGQALGSGQAQILAMGAGEIPAARRLAAGVEDVMAKSTKPTPRELAARQEYAPAAAAAKERLMAAKPKPSTEPITAARQQLTERIRGNVEETHAAVRQQLDTRWQNMRDKVGEAPADPAKLSQIETDARTSHLATATPDAVAKFDTVMDRVRETGATPEAALEQKVAEGLGYKSAEQARRRVPLQAFDGLVERLKSEGTTEAPGNNFADLQNRYTRLGEELSKGNLPGETFRALKQVREGYGQHMQEIAGQRGMGNELSNLKSDWSQYMEDFRNTDSPVARALNAKDLPVVTRNATGNTYARFAEIMGRNRQHGGNPVLVQELAGLKAREVAVKATKVTKPTSVAKKTAAPSRLKIMLGGVAGGVAGTVVGHPVLGYYAGKEAARAYIGRGKK